MAEGCSPHTQARYRNEPDILQPLAVNGMAEFRVVLANLDGYVLRVLCNCYFGIT